MPLPRLNEDEVMVIADAVVAVERLVDLALPGGILADLKARGRVSARAKWLLNELERLARELGGIAEPEEHEPDLAEIAAKVAEIRDARLARMREPGL